MGSGSSKSASSSSSSRGRSSNSYASDQIERDRLTSQNNSLEAEKRGLERSLNGVKNSNRLLENSIDTQKTKLNNESAENNNIISDQNSKVNAWRSNNKELTGTNIPNQQSVVTTDESTMSLNKMTVRGKIFDYLKSKLKSIHAKQEYYNAVKNENNVIVDKVSTIHETSSGDEDSLQHKQTQIGDLIHINTFLFFLYYVLYFYFCFLVYFMKNISVYARVFFVFILLLYPFFIIDVQTFFYYLGNRLYLNINSVYTIEDIH
jgi:hypothetical protein